MLQLALSLALVASGTPHRELLRPVESTSDNYGETTTFVAELDDGTYVLVQLGISNIGPGSGHGICRALVVGPKDAPWSKSHIVSRDAWHYRKTPRQRLEVGACYAEIGPSQTEVMGVLDDGRVHLQVAAAPHPIAAPGADLTIASGHHRAQIWFVAAPVTVHLALPKRPARSVHGSLYADHSFSTVDPDKIARQWIRFRALRPNGPVLLQARQAVSGAFSPVWLRHNGRFEVLSSQVSLKRSEQHGKPHFTVTLRTTAGQTLTLRSTTFLFRYSALDALGFWKHFVAPFVGSPVTFTTRATLSGLGPQDIVGILEVEIDNT